MAQLGSSPPSWTPPNGLVGLWERIRAGFAVPVHVLGQDIELCHALFNLSVIADQVCERMLEPPPRNAKLSKAGMARATVGLLCRFKLQESGPATLCIEIDPSRARVLPKLHTPMSGLTSRSLSLHLALVPPNETRTAWRELRDEKERDEVINLLLVPWPFQVDANQFAEARRSGKGVLGRDGRKRFSYTHRFRIHDLIAPLRRWLQEAEKAVDHVNLIVFPEAALSDKDFKLLCDELKTEAIVCGVFENADTNAAAENCVAIYSELVGSHRQRKHHAWIIDKSQIRQYGLGGILNSGDYWSEHVVMGEREIRFGMLTPDFIFSVLVCEDLARPDPAGDVLRSVAPDLLIALLADGPQLKSRWPARYATVYADDPGSSVLTLTSLGMSTLSQPADRATTSRGRCVALWKEYGREAEEIDLPDDHHAVLLSLSLVSRTEVTADGRKDAVRFPTLDNKRFFSLNPEESKTILAHRR